VKKAIKNLSYYFFPGPIKSKYLAKILEFLFPDSIEGSSFQYPKEFTRSRELADVGGIGIKSCPMNGLVWRLTLALCHSMQFLGRVKISNLFS
jgi:hypothetical protein